MGNQCFENCENRENNGREEISLVTSTSSPDKYSKINWYTPATTKVTSSNGNIFHGTGPLCGEFTGYRWIPLIKASALEFDDKPV